LLVVELCWTWRLLLLPLLPLLLRLLLPQVAYTSLQRNVLRNITQLRAAANATTTTTTSSSAPVNTSSSTTTAFSGRRLLSNPAAAAGIVADMPLSDIAQPWVEGTAWGRGQQPFANVIVHQSFQVRAQAAARFKCVLWGVEQLNLQQAVEKEMVGEKL
jgi:hypothetical protein